MNVQIEQCNARCRFLNLGGDTALFCWASGDSILFCKYVDFSWHHAGDLMRISVLTRAQNKTDYGNCGLVVSLKALMSNRRLFV